ncbi:MAG: hypothetical protein DRH51_06855 [Candidatus Coatesbacteria bacterium]|nr:MAG: hypothetical protein DRH51_06855 [Candidatus Coatesbacteria bacterium]RLC41912.1 MAG: hypothetical protein DRH49_04640 [Candidatus Coatesbacteria bacterium]RLC42917.1 MAG: hypothetical protein DRH44_05690 [Candidatus Coatesbacteria bacterium]
MPTDYWNEPIKVGAIFSRSGINPVWFEWNHTRYQIRSITYRWDERKGAHKIFCFSVTDGVDLFEIAFDPVQIEWRILSSSCST